MKDLMTEKRGALRWCGWLPDAKCLVHTNQNETTQAKFQRAVMKLLNYPFILMRVYIDC